MFSVEEILQRRLTMAGVLHITLLLFLHCGSFILISADDKTTVRPTLDPERNFTTTQSLFPAENTSTTEGPTTGFTTSYSKTTAKPTTTTEHVTEDAGKRRKAEKDTEEEEEEGPLELGE